MGGLRRTVVVFVRALAAGLCIWAALPPMGWWPLAFVGIALWDRLLAGTGWTHRLRRSFLVGLAWFVPSTLWMLDFTPPGYVVAVLLFSVWFAIAGAVTPPGRARWIAFPAALTLATYVMGTFPFGGVPMSYLALTQAGSCGPPCTALDSPLPQAARLLGPLLVTALVGIGGVALSAAWQRRWRPAGIALAVIVVTVALGAVAPQGSSGPPMRIAAVQGGGPQHTPPGNDDAAEVFRRHVRATRDLVQGPVDLIVWPENVVATFGPLTESAELKELQALAAEKGAPILAGVTEDVVGQPTFYNASILVNPDGTVGERFDKVQRVPFGEYVPFRDLVTRLAGDQYLPPRDAVAGTGTGVVHTAAGPVGVVISWEDFFSERARDAVANGGEVLLNPTNGSSYWLTQVQSQQLASSRLRAIETGRWMVQAAPTGFSAVFDEGGALLDRTDLEEAEVIMATVERRTGSTLATLVGPWPALVLALAGVAVGWVLQRRGVGTDDGDRAGDPIVLADGPDAAGQTSTSTVTGPSLTSSTAMSAPNRPVATDAPS